MHDSTRKIRVLMAKPGLDGHDRGVKVLIFGLRDEGFEVIYTGMRQTAGSIVQTCIQEDAQVVGLSSLSGGHLHHFPRVSRLLGEKGMGDVLVIGGGIIPDEDVPVLKEKGIRAVFGPGTELEEIVRFIRENVKIRDSSTTATVT